MLTKSGLASFNRDKRLFKLIESISPLVLQHEQEKVNSAREENVVIEGKTEVTTLAVLDQLHDAYVAEGKKERPKIEDKNPKRC